MTTSTSPSTTPALYFQSLNPLCEKTILLLHSGYNSHREYSFVVPHLSSYHLIIPDLPSHGRPPSLNVPFSPTDAAALLADLIARESKSGKAHVVGISMGGYIALYLAAKYPDVVNSVFVSGCGNAFGNDSLFMRYAGAFFLGLYWPTFVLCISSLPPNWFESVYGHWGLSVPEGLQKDQRAAAGYGVGFGLAGALLRNEFRSVLLERIRARTIVVAAAKNDDVEGTRSMGVGLRKGNSGSRAVKVEGMKHIWCLQDPGLFAKCVEAWLEDEEVADELEGL